MRMTPLEDRIYAIASPVAQDMGLALVHIKTIGEDSGMTLQIMAEDPATGRLGIDECAKLSRALSAVLDVEDPINGRYRLEVSSPGIDRPLTRESDFDKYNGFEIKCETQMPDENGQKRYRGFINSFTDGMITLQTDTGEKHIPFTDMVKAKLVLTDELIKKTAQSDS